MTFTDPHPSRRSFRERLLGPEDEERLLAAVQEYLQAVEAGHRPDQAAFVCRFPHLADALEECLAGLEFVQAATQRIHPARALAVSAETVPLQTLGDFRIVREIGRGGMGIVYEAVQVSLGRPVALKVLPLAAALDGRQLQRFKNEAQAAAFLHHQHIVPVYAVGVERGVHYYAMQLIDGPNLASLLGAAKPPRRMDLARALRGENATTADPSGPAPAPAASTRADFTPPFSTLRAERPVEFFQTVARLASQAAVALDYAHGLGVVHRDIKPANLLLDGRGHLWITDFGLAQFRADTGLTQSGDMLGTLRYMNPEQAGGRRPAISHLTDVYSLGATLYELVTGRPIFDGADRETLLHQILHEEPRTPRAVDRAVPVELETIILKAVAKEPAERYATAQELADDLDRFLHDRPIRARRPSLWEQALRRARRHRGVVVSAVVCLLLLVAGLSVAMVLTAEAYERERELGRQAKAAALEAEQQRARAKESFRQAQEAVAHLAQIGEEELAGNPGLEWLRLRLLEATLSYYQDFIAQSADDPSVQGELEVSRAKVKTILGQLTTLTRANQYTPLHMESVQHELDLSEYQRRQIEAMGRNWAEKSQKANKRGPAEREQQRLDLARDQEERVAKLLTAAQHRRFKQIALQFLGPQAFADPEIAATLQLTADQKRRIRAIQDTVQRPPGSGRPDAKAQAVESIRALLTPVQRDQWAELVGAPFEGEFHRGPPGPPGPRRPPKQRD
jgi:serine/threonine protein kinase